MVNRFGQWSSAAFDERDGLGEYLAIQVAIGNPLFLVPQFLWWTARRTMGLLRRLMCVFVGGMLQKMEFDADQYETAMVGSRTFESTCYRLRHLGVAMEQSFKDLSNFNRNRSLADNLPKMIVRNANRLSPDLKEVANRDVQNAPPAGMFETHPADLQRIEKSLAENQSGIFHVAAPSSALFNDFDKLCKNVTWDLYRRFIGSAFDPSQMQSLDELFESTRVVEAAAEKVDERLAGVFQPLRGMRNTKTFIGDEIDSKQRLSDLKKARAEVINLQGDYFCNRNEFDTQTNLMLEAEQGAAELTCTMFYPDQKQDMLSRSQAEALRAKVAAESKLRVLQQQMVAAEDAQGNRIMAALDLVSTGKVKFNGWEEIEDKASDVLFAVQAMSEALSHVLVLQLLLAGQKSALNTLREGDVPEPVIRLVLESNEQIHMSIGKMRQSLDSANYPLGSSKNNETLTVGGYLGTHRFGNQFMGTIEEPGQLCATTEQFLSDFLTLHKQLAGYLAEAVEKIETKIGFSPMPKSVSGSRSRSGARGQA